jgi:hypothetical protein
MGSAERLAPGLGDFWPIPVVVRINPIDAWARATGFRARFPGDSVLTLDVFRDLVSHCGVVQTVDQRRTVGDRP